MSRLSFGPALSLKGRQWKGLRGWSGKPAHPPLTDVVTGGYVLVAVFDVVSLAGRNQPWGHDFYRAATFVLLASAAVSLVTALTGFLDWRTTETGSEVRRTANAHAWTMLTVTALVLGDAGLRALRYWDAASAPPVVVVLSVVAAALTVLGGTIGGSLTYDHGFNVEAAADGPAWHRRNIEVALGSSAGRPTTSAQTGASLWGAQPPGSG